METDNTVAYSGNQSLRIVGIVATEIGAHSVVRHTLVPAENGQVYTVAFWAKVDEREGQRRPVRVSARLGHEYWPGFYNSSFMLDSTDWKEYTDTFVVPLGVSSDIWVGLAVAESDVDFWIDDFRFFEGHPTDEIKKEPTEPDVIKGDVNGDGKFSSSDAILILRIIAGLMIPTDSQRLAADVNGDGEIGSNDAILILRIVAGLAAPI